MIGKPFSIEGWTCVREIDHVHIESPDGTYVNIPIEVWIYSALRMISVAEYRTIAGAND